MSDRSKARLQVDSPLSPDESKALEIVDQMVPMATLIPCVAHEINNPITYILANLDELAKLSTAMREAILEYRKQIVRVLGEDAAAVIASTELKVHLAGGMEVLDEIHDDTHEGAVRIRDVVRDLLAVSRTSASSAVPIDVHTLLDSSLRLVAKRLAERAALGWDYQATKSIEGDPSRLAQVFINLITNAIHACEPPDPKLHRVFVRTLDLPDGIEVQIEDSGAGIPAEIQEKIFSAFFTTKESGLGTGLGLYISRRIIEDHGGSIHFTCKEPTGTIFRVRLPERSTAREG